MVWGGGEGAAQRPNANFFLIELKNLKTVLEKLSKTVGSFKCPKD